MTNKIVLTIFALTSAAILVDFIIEGLILGRGPSYLTMILLGIFSMEGIGLLLFMIWHTP